MIEQKQEKVDSLGILSMTGPSKYTKEQYINTYLFVLAKVGESIATSENVSEIDTKADFLLNFITKRAERDKIRKSGNEMYDKLCEDYKVKYGQPAEDNLKIMFKRQSANSIIGLINEYFDDTWGWSRSLKIAIAGPRGGTDQRFIPIKLLPDDLQSKLVDAMSYPKKNGAEEDDDE